MATATERSKTNLRRSFESPDEIRNVPKGKIEVVNLGDVTAMRATFEPGWKWSECVKPIAGTESCEVAHLGYMLAGRMGLLMDDGTAIEYGPGDIACIPPGHDAWTLGEEPLVILDFQGGSIYAKPAN